MSEQLALWCFPLAADAIQSITVEEGLLGKIDSIIQHFVELFVEPKRLAPKHSNDHHIELLFAATSISIRPYRYSHSQKAEIEYLVNGRIRLSVY